MNFSAVAERAGVSKTYLYNDAELRKRIDDLRDQTALVSVAAWRHDPDWLQTPSWEHEAAEHRAVLRAAEDGDAERAAALLSGHITSFVARKFPEPQENQNV